MNTNSLQKQITSEALSKAKQRLQSEQLTCAIYKNGLFYTSRERGVHALLDWLDQGTDLSLASASDRVVGNGAAFLYVLLGVREVYADVMSLSALQTLTEHGILCEYLTLTEAIRNRRRDGFCPIESAVNGETDPQNALQKIRAKLKSLSKS